MMTRDEHLQWAKERALDYVRRGQFADAFCSLASDLDKHPDLANHPFMLVGAQLLLAGFLDSQTKMTEWIEGWR